MRQVKAPKRKPKYPLISKVGIRLNRHGLVTSAALDKALTPMLREAFNKVFGRQTCAVVDGVAQMYPWDVERALAGLPPLD